MAVVHAMDVESAPSTTTTSEEQVLRRERKSQDISMSKTKMYSMIFTILLLFSLLVATNLSDWQTYATIARDESDVVRGDGGDLEIKDLDKLQRDLDGLRRKRAKRERARGGGKGEKVVDVANVRHEATLAKQSVKIHELEDDVRKLKQEKAKAKKPKEKKAKKAKGGASRADKVSSKAGTKAGKKGKKSVHIYMTAEEKKIKAREKIKPNSAKALGHDGYLKYLEDDYKKKLKNHEQKMVPRKFTLSPDLQKIVDDYDNSLKPPEYCYVGVDGHTRVHPREPDEEDAMYADLSLGVAKKILRLAAADYPCIIATQNCMNVTKYPKQGERNFKQIDQFYFRTKDGSKVSTLTRDEKVAKLPRLEEESFGTCAIVGNADNMLEGQYGKEIDAHDFVVRFNVVTLPFKDAVGTKAEGMLIKTNYKATEYERDVIPTMYNFFPKFVPFELGHEDLPGGKPALVYGVDLDLWRRDEEQMFWAYLEEKNLTHFGGEHRGYGIPKLPHPTGGISRARALLHLLRSGICSRLDMYGFSVGGGKYFQPEKTVSHAHPIQSENYFYRLWMATGVQGKFCVYGK